MTYRNVALSKEAHATLKLESAVKGVPMGVLLNKLIKEKFE